MKTLPTPRELVKLVTNQNKTFFSVAYGDSRSILKYLDVPVIAYGLGYAGFVCIIQMKRGCSAYTYACKKPMSHYTDGGFCLVDIDSAMEVIENNKLFAERSLNKSKVGKAYTTVLINRPVLGSFEFNQQWSGGHKSKHIYRFVRLKNGKVRAECRSDYGSSTFSHNPLEYALSKFELSRIPIEKVKEKDRDFDGITNINMPEALVQEIKDAILLKSI